MDLSFIKKAAPWIGTAISATVPGAAPIVAIASKLLTDGLGVKVAANAQGVSEAIATAMANPDQLAKLKEIDNAFAIQMRQLDIQSVEDLERIGAEDRASAREREKVVKDKLPSVLALSITFGFFLLLAAIMKYPMPTSSEKVMDIMLGTLATAWISVVSYYFGSSSGSARKSELLASQAEKKE